MFGSGYVSRYVSAMYRRYMALDETDVAGVCFGVCLRGSNMRFLHEFLTRHFGNSHADIMGV